MLQIRILCDDWLFLFYSGFYYPTNLQNVEKARNFCNFINSNSSFLSQFCDEIINSTKFLEFWNHKVTKSQKSAYKIPQNQTINLLMRFFYWHFANYVGLDDVWCTSSLKCNEIWTQSHCHAWKLLMIL